MNMLLLAQTFGERMTTPIWQDWEILGSPAAIVSYAGIGTAWVIFQQFREVVKAVREAWPHIQPILLLLVEALRRISPETPDPVPTPTPQPVVTTPVQVVDDREREMAIALRNWKAAQAEEKDDTAKLWADEYNRLKKQLGK